MSAQAALCFDAVSVKQGDRWIVRSVSFEIAAGEIVALAGPNGAGKTTLLRVASRVLAASEGSVRVQGRALDAWSRREFAQRVAVVPQDANIAFPFSAAEVVLMGRTPYLGPMGFESALDLEKAREAMARVGIEALADRSMLELSGGERQLVLVARALVQEPDVLLLDEPTAHLDLAHRMAVLEQVTEFARRGGAVLIISHDLGLAARSCQRLALLAGGELRACGPPRELLNRTILRDVFGVDAEVFETPDGSIAVVTRGITRPAGSAKT